MDVEQRALLTVQYRDSRAEGAKGAVVGRRRRKKELPSMEFALWAMKEMLPEQLNEDNLKNNCAKYFILAQAGYRNREFDGLLDMGPFRKVAMDRGMQVVNRSAKWMQAWADIERIIK